MSEYKYSQGDWVVFEWSGIKGSGTIVGCSLIDLPIVGKHYMVKLNDPSKINLGTYPFDTVSIPECAFYN